MPFTVIESLCASGKGSDDRKEDRLVITDDFAAVIDGATSSGPLRGVPGGIVAAEAVAEAITTLPADCDARRFVDLASEELDRRIGADHDPAAMRPSASVVVWSRMRNEIWRVGDCHFRLDDQSFNGEKAIDKLSYGFRAAVLRGRLALGLTTVEAEQKILALEQPFLPLVKVQHAFLNVDSDDPLYYGAIDGRPVPDRFVEVCSVGDARQIILCSDGFIAPPATLAEGLAELARLKAVDPLQIGEPAGSRPFPPGSDYFDDTTYVRIGLG